MSVLFFRWDSSVRWSFSSVFDDLLMLYLVSLLKGLEEDIDKQQGRLEGAMATLKKTITDTKSMLSSYFLEADV